MNYEQEFVKSSNIKSKLKKVATLTLVANLIVTNTTPMNLVKNEIVFADEILNSDNTLRGTIDCYIRFDETPTEEELDLRGITITLKKDGAEDLIVPLSKGMFLKSGNNVESWKVTFEVEAGAKDDIYSLEFYGEGHRTFVVDDISLDRKSVV